MYTLEQRAAIASQLTKAAEALGTYRYAKLHKQIKAAYGVEIPHTTIARVLHGGGLDREITDGSRCYAQDKAIPYIAKALSVALTETAPTQAARLKVTQTLLPLDIPAAPTATVSLKVSDDNRGFSIAKAKVALAALKEAGLPTGEAKAAILSRLAAELDLG